MAPKLSIRLFGGEPSDTAATIIRMFGSRDALLAVGQILGDRHGSGRGFYEAAAVADILDAGIMALAAKSGAMPVPIAAIAASTALCLAGAGIAFARGGEEADPLDAALDLGTT